MGWRITMKHPLSIILAMLVAFGAFASAQASDLLGVRFGPDKGKTRIVFDISGAPVYSISGDETGKGRLIVDFNELSAAPGALALNRGKGHIAQYQFVRRADGGLRAVFAFKQTAEIKENFVIEPSPGVAKHRLVIDLASADKKAFIASLPTRYPDLSAVIERATAESGEFVAPAKPRQQREVKAPQGAKRIIVVDAGHGGKDPGAQGQSGTYEKNVTLKAALTLKEILEKTGNYDVVLTRTSNDDKAIVPNQAKELARRERLAREAGANLFISLHADALGAKQVRGGSVYTLSEKGSERTAKLAKSTGDYRVIGNLDVAEYDELVGNILFDKAQNETNNASALFARKLLKELTGKTPLLNKSLRTADLRVLLAPDVPAVLFEMAYISNIKDEANLNSPAWRKRTMGAVADAIEAYFEDYDARRFAQTAPTGTN